MNQYAIYLRKSRADLEAEARGEGETLARHRAALRSLAERRGLYVAKEYSELVTGDSIAARPQMQALLEDVKRGMYAGVIVNDVDRLGRGDSIDQEIIKYTFVAGHCLIITPSRDINPASPTDEDVLDFSMFFARFEYRKIAQRLTQGRTRSAIAGNFISARVPYGYRKVTKDNRITLEVDEDSARIVRLIFNWYANHQYGLNAIATKLNDMGLRTYRGYTFSRATVKNMLRNPIYTGRIVWGKTTTIPSIEDGHRSKKHIASTPSVAENAHPAIVSDELFERVQGMFKEADHLYPKNTAKALKNPLAGLLYCSRCGKAMCARGKPKGRFKDVIITCVTYGCPTRGTYKYILENAVLEILREWTADYKEPPQEEPSQIPDEQDAVTRKQIEVLEGQMAKAQELVELGVYTPSEYLKRKADLQSRLDAAKAMLKDAPTISTAQAINAIVPTIEKVLDAYQYAETVEDKNRLLKQVVARIEYTKDEVATKAIPSESLVSLVVYPRIGNSV